MNATQLKELAGLDREASVPAGTFLRIFKCYRVIIFIQIENNDHYFRFESLNLIVLSKNRMIARTQHRNITEWLGKGKAIIVIGPRQVGKTTLVRQITQKLEQKVLWLTGDDPETRAQLDNISLARLAKISSDNMKWSWWTRPNDLPIPG